MIKYKQKPHLKDFDYRGCYRYFVTICTDRKKYFFVNSDQLIEKIIEFLGQSGERNLFRVWVYCFMPDHLHLLVEGINADADLKKFIKDFKQRTGCWFTHEEANAGNKLWQPGYYEHVLRQEEDTSEIMRYILNNPVRRGLLTNYLEYRYSGSLAINIKEILF